jgi:MMP 1-O-methyltransferase
MNKMQGLVNDAEAIALADMAAQVTDGVIVEIGSYTGKSTVAMATSTERQVYALDLWDMRLPGESGPREKHRRKIPFASRAAFITFQKRTNKLSNVTWFKGDSAQAAKLWNQPIGLLFIDGAHDVKSVTADYQGFAPYVVPGGFLALHDATTSVKVGHVVEEVIKPSGLWDDWQYVDRLAIARRK